MGGGEELREELIIRKSSTDECDAVFESRSHALSYHSQRCVSLMQRPFGSTIGHFVSACSNRLFLQCSALRGIMEHFFDMHEATVCFAALPRNYRSKQYGILFFSTSSDRLSCSVTAW